MTLVKNLTVLFSYNYNKCNIYIIYSRIIHALNMNGSQLTWENMTNYDIA